MNNDKNSLDRPAADYFETGCLCVLSGRVAKLPPTVSDAQAYRYYLKACNCSRSNGMKGDLDD